MFSHTRKNMIEYIAKFIFNKKSRMGFLNNVGFYKHLDDEKFLKKQYYILTGKHLNLADPASFNEKLQWLKLNDRKPVYTDMVDKIKAKEYVASIIGEKYIIPTLGTWESFDDIDFDMLPEQFVLKCNHDSGGLVIVRDKATLDINKAKKKIEHSLKTNYFYNMREWPYKNIHPQIFAEKYMGEEKKGLTDYKFFNFNGESKFLYISEGLENHSSASISFFDFYGKQLSFKRSDYKAFKGDYILPDNFHEMHKVSDILAKEINSPFVRTDFYSINGQVYFSEITFSPCGGIIPFDPPEWDEKLGKILDISGVRIK